MLTSVWWLQNGHPTNPYCEGIEGVLQAYYQTLQRVQLYGPTNFSPVINHVARYSVITTHAHYFCCLFSVKFCYCSRCSTLYDAKCCSISVYFFTFYRVTLMPSVLWRCWLGGRKGIRPVKKLSGGCWHGYLSGARCRLAYSPADATATHCLLLQ